MRTICRLGTGFLLIFLSTCGSQKTATEKVQSVAEPPMPLLPVPTARQLDWQRAELVMFLHFGVNTFTDREWGEGTEDPGLFNPTELDAGQWARVAAEAGFKTLILTAKHHDGFCLWPSRYTEHSVKNSPWKNGQGDVVKDLARACRDNGLKMGLYLSPWDRHETTYGQGDRYNLYYLAQLRELSTDYGPLAEVWFDGACGEGPNGRVQKYVFPVYWSLVRQKQPNAVIFSDAGPDVRWIGNERGFAGETCWSMIDRSQVAVGDADTRYLNSGDIEGPDWVPGECDVSIRKGWFWHADQEPKSLEQLLDIYFKSVGRNGVLLLNVPPDKNGLLSQVDVDRLHEFRKTLDDIFNNPIAIKSARSNHLRGQDIAYDASNTLDGDPETYWAPDDTVSSAWIEFDLDSSQTFNTVQIQEPVSLGQRVKSHRIDVWQNRAWSTVAKGTTIGYKRLLRFENRTSTRVRLVIEASRACPLIAEFTLFNVQPNF